jgi:hypothetical protein
VLVAKDSGASRITAVEMDEAMVAIVKTRFQKELNYLFEDPTIQLIANEGRSYVHSSQETFDIIQQINNQTSIAIASGALNLSETFLLTREAFNLYLDHLSDQGILSVWKWGIERMFTTAIIVLHERGVAEPYKHIFVIKHKDFYQRLFLLKKSPFTTAEINTVVTLCTTNSWEILYNPAEPYKSPLYSRLLSPENIRAVSSSTGLDLLPATDNKPFFNHFMAFWHRKVTTTTIIPQQLTQMIETLSRTERFTLGIIFIQSIIFSFLFLILPLLKFKKEGVHRQATLFTILYFSCLGIGFIFLEIVLMQKFVLYLGHPSYSISIILFSLLVSAGIGSYCSEFLMKAWGTRIFYHVLFPGLLAVILFFIVGLDSVIHHTIGYHLYGKALITFVIVFLLGFFLGMPFPTGLARIKNESITMVGWAWAVNAYMTVVGSLVSIVIALSSGFRTVIIISFFCYLIAYLSIRKSKN